MSSCALRARREHHHHHHHHHHHLPFGAAWGPASARRKPQRPPRRPWGTLDAHRLARYSFEAYVEAISVVFLPRLRGTLPYAPSLPSAPSPSAASWRCQTRSSRRCTRDAWPRSDSRATATSPALPRRARRLLWTFFERPAAREARNAPTHRGAVETLMLPKPPRTPRGAPLASGRDGLRAAHRQFHPSSSRAPFLAGGPGMG